jgi:hypothetical protein
VGRADGPGKERGATGGRFGEGRVGELNLACLLIVGG